LIGITLKEGNIDQRSINVRKDLFWTAHSAMARPIPIATMTDIAALNKRDGTCCTSKMCREIFGRFTIETVAMGYTVSGKMVRRSVQGTPQLPRQALRLDAALARGRAKSQ
jgi:hypothetical protein